MESGYELVIVTYLHPCFVPCLNLSVQSLIFLRFDGRVGAAKGVLKRRRSGRTSSSSQRSADDYSGLWGGVGGQRRMLIFVLVDFTTALRHISNEDYVS